MLLFVTERKQAHTDIFQRLNHHGIFFYVTPFETAEFLCAKKDIGGVVIDGVAETERAKKLCEALRVQQPKEMPIALIATPRTVPNLSIDCLIRDMSDKELLFGEILDFCTDCCGWNAKTLSTFSLLICEDRRKTRYMGYDLPLSVYEHKILRCLFYRAPLPFSKEDLNDLCFLDGKHREDSIAVLISRINQRASKIDPDPLIVSVRNQGYRLRDGILQ